MSWGVLMKNITTTKTAGCMQLGNKNTNPIQQLATAWISYNDEVTDSSRMERLAEALDKTLKAMLPDGRLRDITRGREGEIRNEAALACLDSFFAGNDQLVEATVNFNSDEIVSQLRRSINAAMRIQSARIRKEMASDAKRFVSVDEELIPQRDTHPAVRKSEWELSPSLHVDFVLNAIDQALSDEELPEQTLSIIREMVDEGLTQSQVARRHKISKAAVNQRLKRAASAINRAISKAELPSIEN
jgi:hypothetical protein